MSEYLRLENINFIDTPNDNIITPHFTYIFDRSYMVPKSHIYLVLEYEDFFYNHIDYSIFFKVKEEQFFMLHEFVLRDNLVEVSINMIDYGIEIHLEGMSTRIKDIFESLLDFIFTNKNNDRLSLVISQIKDNLIKEKFTQSYKRLFQKLKSVYFRGYKNPEEILEDFSFSNDLSINKQFSYNLFVVGNIIQKEAIDIENIIKKYKVNKNTNFCHLNDNIPKEVFINTFDICNNSSGLFFPTNKVDDLEGKVISDFIIMSSNEMFFDQLRTNEEFGYVVTANSYTLRDIHFMYFVVQSEKNTNEIKNRIIKFINFLKEYLQKMKENEFLERKESLLDFYNESYKNLSDFAHFIYKKGLVNINGLEYTERIVRVLDNLKLQDVQRSKVLDDYIVISTIKK